LAAFFQDRPVIALRQANGNPVIPKLSTSGVRIPAISIADVASAIFPALRRAREA
jgi:hypothetical protein